ncbi:hypothetical protein BGX38DRAFT_1156765 [Terfezia claveryi]|nr:hypothetical protein BGX38DRAFT_1156765 [Terfezia claveryi]
MYKMQAIALLYATHLILSSYPRGLNEWLSSFSVKIRHRMRITRADFRSRWGGLNYTVYLRRWSHAWKISIGMKHSHIF